MKKLIAFSWYGGKNIHLDWLLPIIDNVSHVTYVEPFGGSAAVLLNKRPSPVEVYNDIYSEVVNFFRVLRDNGQELKQLLELTPYSREEFSLACKEQGTTNIEKARRFFVKAQQVNRGLVTTATPGRWGYSIDTSRKGTTLNISKWFKAIRGLEEMCDRLKRTQIEDLDVLELIDRYDREMTLFYLDPPYYSKQRTGGKAYKFEMDESQHKELLTKLLSIKGKAIISGYENNLYSDMLKDWPVYKDKGRNSSSTRKEKGTGKLKREILWSNFQPRVRKRLFT
jgi:DNA adenine methylase